MCMSKKMPFITFVIIYMHKLLDSDWLKTSATFMKHGCKVRNTGSKLCNTGANYKWALIGSKNNRNYTRANQVRAVDNINRNKIAAAVGKVWREQKHILIQAKFSRINGITSI